MRYTEDDVVNFVGITGSAVPVAQSYLEVSSSTPGSPQSPMNGALTSRAESDCRWEHRVGD